jgi:Radical SAM superfamily/B12 binding domain
MFRVAIAQFDGATTMRAPPLAAGLLAATLRQEAGLDGMAIEVLAARREPDGVAAVLAEADVVGVSLYTWNQRYALEVARRARGLRRELCVVAGGPSVPRRPEASAAFLAAHPWVDALVLGEGERAFVDIVRAVRGGAGVAGLPGVVARDGDGVCCGPPRPRLEGDGFAGTGSPYLDGTFDELVARGEIGPITTAVLETNRGCPFACTFCDWGQATQSRIHELPGERVMRELAWLAERGVPYLYLVDANFGIRRRDVEITRAIGELARRHSAPRFVFFHLTKNATTKNLRTVEILREHGVATQVALSMQDFDAEVLLAIKRDNIHPQDALDLRERCHAQGLPTLNELMLGLPAQTAASIRTSIAAAITPFPQDSFFLYPTRVLDNAELAEPGYRARHGIETRRVPTWPPDPGDDPFVVEDEELVVGTRTLPVAAWCDAHAFGYLLSALWNQRVLQTTLHVMQFVLGIGAAALVDALLAAPSPRLAAIRAELARFSAAIVEGRATTLAVDGWGSRRREPLDAACARVLDDPAGFYAETAEVAAALAGGDAALVRDAVAWDALQLPASEGGAATAEFAYDWLAYAAQMGSRPRPDPRRIAVRAVPWPLGAERATRLDAFLALGWAKQPRGQIECVL